MCEALALIEPSLIAIFEWEQYNFLNEIRKAAFTLAKISIFYAGRLWGFNKPIFYGSVRVDFFV